MKKITSFLLPLILAVFCLSAKAQNNPTLIYPVVGITNYDSGHGPTGKQRLGLDTNNAAVGRALVFTNVSPYIKWVPFPTAGITNVANLGLTNSIPIAVSNGIAYFKPLVPGAYIQLLDTGTNLVPSVTNLDVTSSSLFVGTWPAAKLGAGSAGAGNLFLNDTNGWTAPAGGGGSGNADTSAVFQTWLPTGSNLFGNVFSKVLMSSNGPVLDLTNAVTIAQGKTWRSFGFLATAGSVGAPSSSSNITTAVSTANFAYTVTNSANFNGVSGQTAGQFFFLTLYPTNNPPIGFNSAIYKFDKGYPPVIGTNYGDTNRFLFQEAGGFMWNLGKYVNRDTRTRTFTSTPINILQTNTYRMTQYKAIANFVGAATGNAVLEIRNGAGATLDRESVNGVVFNSDRGLDATIQPGEVFFITNLTSGSGASVTLITNVLTEITDN